MFKMIPYRITRIEISVCISTIYGIIAGHINT